MKKKLNFKHKAVQDSKSISNYLKMLASAFKGGELVLRKDKEQLILKFNDTLEFKMKASKKNKKSKVSLTFDWTEE